MAGTLPKNVTPPAVVGPLRPAKAPRRTQGAAGAGSLRTLVGTGHSGCVTTAREGAKELPGGTCEQNGSGRNRLFCSIDPQILQVYQPPRHGATHLLEICLDLLFDSSVVTRCFPENRPQNAIITSSTGIYFSSPREAPVKMIYFPITGIYFPFSEAREAENRPILL